MRRWGKTHGYTDLPEGSMGKPSSDDLRHPVVGVSWYDAVKWCNAASEEASLDPCYTVGGKTLRTGGDESVACDWNAGGYRLATEAEWEYASQAGSDACWYWGGDKGYKYAWRGGHEARKTSNTGGTSHPVGLKYGNHFGLYDTIGNVWEWCWDWKAPHLMNLDTTLDPKGPATRQEIADFLAKAAKWKGKEAIEKNQRSLGRVDCYKGGRTMKGGAYDTMFGYFGFCCSQFRAGLAPEKSDAAVGFRVVVGGE